MGGRLDRRQQAQIAGATLREVGGFIRSQLALATGRGPRSADVDPISLTPPDSRLTRAVVHVATTRQSPAMYRHALRTFAFGHAIAQHHRVRLEPELYWCAALLHDVELEHPQPDTDFAVRGALTAIDTLLDAGATQADADAVGDAICRHTTPGLDPGEHPIGWAISTGAMADIVGQRRELLRPSFVADTVEAHPDDGFGHALRDAWRAEARSCGGGRPLIIQRASLLPWVAAYWPR